MICPICGRNGVKESRQCPARRGRPVCEKCCKQCEYRGKNGNPCLYYANSPQARLREELTEKKKRAEFLRKTADRLWERGMNYAASQKEAEWRNAVQDVLRMEEEINEND